MKSSLLFFLTILLFTFGCKSSTEPTLNNKLGSSITVTSSSSPSLDGGGRWFAGADTGVWYDIHASYSLNNTSATTSDITYKLEIGEYKNGAYQPGNGELFFDGDSIIVGASHISGNSITTLTIQPTIGVGRKNAKDWSYSYGYRLTLYDKATNDSLVITDSLSGSTPQNRFHGIIYTTESSPDPFGIIDGPDDGDWQMKGTPPSGLEPCFPNPAHGNIVSRIEIPHRDSVVLTLNKTRNLVVKLLISDIYDPGKYDVDILLDGLKYGQYRLFGRMVDSSKIFISYGDIMLPHP